MTDTLNGTPTLSQAQRARKLPSYDAALMEMQRRLGLSGCVGTVTFALYADGSFVATPTGTVTVGLHHAVGRWALDELGGAIAELRAERLNRTVSSPIRQ